MKAPKYIDNSLFSFIERTRKKKQHLDYLSNIKKDQRFQTDIKEHLEIISKYQTNKINTSIVNYQNRINELENRNKKIMGKIISISNRDLKKKNTSGGLLPLGSFPHDKFQVQSLTFLTRKKEAKKVLLENYNMANRLLNKHTSIPLKTLKKDFQNHELYRNRIRKMTPLNTMKIRGLDSFENSRSIRSITASNCRTEESKNIKNKVNNKLRPVSLKNVYTKKFNKKS